MYFVAKFLSQGEDVSDFKEWLFMRGIKTVTLKLMFFIVLHLIWWADSSQKEPLLLNLRA